MLSETIAGLGAVKTAFDIAKTLKDMDNATARNAAVIELQEKILTAQQAQAALVERIGELEKEVAGFEQWDAEKQRYQLKDFGGNTFAYELKPDAANGEPMHRICPACYQKGHKSILQFDFVTAAKQQKFVCPSCKTNFEFGQRQSINVSRGGRSEYF